MSATRIEHSSEGTYKTEGTYKDFFFIEKLKFQDSFNCEDIIKDKVKQARSLYTDFYLRNSSVTHCYRSLYRIYCIIEDANIDENDKKQYIKILRAQLTESELFFLRYNANSSYGHKFKRILNKYNVLKHLPLCDLVEFKKYWVRWSELEKESINIVFSNVTSSIRRLLAPRKTRHSIILADSKKYSISIECKQFYGITIVIGIDKTISQCDAMLSAFNKMNLSQISSFLSDYLYEIFYYRSYCMSNHFHHLNVSSEIVTKDNIDYLRVTMSNVKKEPLNLFVKESPLYVDLSK